MNAQHLPFFQTEESFRLDLSAMVHTKPRALSVPQSLLSSGLEKAQS